MQRKECFNVGILKVIGIVLAVIIGIPLVLILGHAITMPIRKRKFMKEAVKMQENARQLDKISQAELPLLFENAAHKMELTACEADSYNSGAFKGDGIEVMLTDFKDASLADKAFEGFKNHLDSDTQDKRPRNIVNKTSSNCSYSVVTVKDECGALYKVGSIVVFVTTYGKGCEKKSKEFVQMLRLPVV
jgi:hypothetical protein